MMRRIDDPCLAVLVLVAALTVAFLVLPIVVSVSMSFDSRGYPGQFPPLGFSLQWYAKFFTDSYFLSGLTTSLVLAVIAACVSTAVGVAAALVIGGYDFPGKETVAACFLSPLMVPSVVIGCGLLMFFAALGVFDGFARLVPDALTCQRIAPCSLTVAGSPNCRRRGGCPGSTPRGRHGRRGSDFVRAQRHRIASRHCNLCGQDQHPDTNWRPVRSAASLIIGMPLRS